MLLLLRRIIFGRYLIGFYRLLFPDKHPDSPAVPEEKGKETTDLEEDGRDCIPCVRLVL